MRSDFDPERSDVDFLVEFQPGGGFSLFDAYFDLREALIALLGRQVDLVMPDAITQSVRSRRDRGRSHPPLCSVSPRAFLR